MNKVGLELRILYVQCSLLTSLHGSDSQLKPSACSETCDLCENSSMALFKVSDLVWSWYTFDNLSYRVMKIIRVFLLCKSFKPRQEYMKAFLKSVTEILQYGFSYYVLNSYKYCFSIRWTSMFMRFIWFQEIIPIRGSIFSANYTFLMRNFKHWIRGK